MAAKTRNRKRKAGAAGTEDQIARLRTENARLRAEIRNLRSQVNATQDGKPTTPGTREATAPRAEVPVLPSPHADGNYPARQTLQVILAQQMIRRREAAGWSQAELAQRAGVRQETVSRIESGKHAPTVTTVDKLDRALRAAGV
jgi:ribosome-binding protein aMBF1 (putative translation factor)